MKITTDLSKQLYMVAKQARDRANTLLTPNAKSKMLRTTEYLTADNANDIEKILTEIDNIIINAQGALSLLDVYLTNQENAFLNK